MPVHMFRGDAGALLRRLPSVFTQPGRHSRSPPVWNACMAVPRLGPPHAARPPIRSIWQLIIREISAGHAASAFADILRKIGFDLRSPQRRLLVALPLSRRRSPTRRGEGSTLACGPARGSEGVRLGKLQRWSRPRIGLTPRCLRQGEMSALALVSRGREQLTLPGSADAPVCAVDRCRGLNTSASPHEARLRPSPVKARCPGAFIIAIVAVDRGHLWSWLWIPPASEREPAPLWAGSGSAGNPSRRIDEAPGAAWRPRLAADQASQHHFGAAADDHAATGVVAPARKEPCKRRREPSGHDYRCDRSDVLHPPKLPRVDRRRPHSKCRSFDQSFGGHPRGIDGS